jgi:threonine/homoserine/homoserine lactone efflux protein
MTLGVIQAMVSFTINLLLVLSAASIAAWFSRNPTWMTLQRYVMGGVLAALAIRIMLEPRRVI